MEEGKFNDKIIKINIEEEMKAKYIDYSMSVIVSRALPDARDGLKPVHRRVLFGMHGLGLSASKSYKKSARIVGEVLGKYHPHGDSSVYGTMVRMAQEWSLRYLMVDGQGNYGSIDGDSPAAMRYTEARLRKLAEEMLADIDKETVDFQLNFDDTIEEPTVLPSKIPNLLVNGGSGIAVGMATNMPPHNMSEVVDGIIAYIEKRGEIEMSELITHVKAPDFPTGGIIYGYEGVKEAFETGRGRIVMRGKVDIEDTDSKSRIIVTEIPYLVNKADMIKKTAELINDKKIDGISDLRDESDRKGIRVVYDLKRDAVPNVVLNKLYKYTALQSSFSVNNVALVKGRPHLLNLKQLIQLYVTHRHEVLVRKLKHELKQAEKRAHILDGLLIALNNLDDIIQLIKSSKNPEEAKLDLVAKFELSEIQAKAILELRLQKLTGLEREKIKTEHKELMDRIDEINKILSDQDIRMNMLIEDLIEVKEKYGDERRSVIDYSGGDFNMEDIIPNAQVVITISNLGYIKRTPLSEYRQQSRGGIGSKGASARNEDFLEDVFVASNHDYLLFFTNKGQCFWLRVYEIPEGSRTSKGRALQNLINISRDEKIMAFVNTKDLKDEEYINNHYIVMCTKKGTVKKTLLEKYSRPRVNGIKAISIKEGDELLEAKLTDGESQIMIAAKSGKSIRFEETKVRACGRTASGVRGIRLSNQKTDEVIGMVCVNDPESSVLVVSENGYGKRSKMSSYRITNRGGKGVKTLNITEKTGSLISLKNVTEENDLMIVNKSGVTIRIAVKQLREMGRATQGVKIIKLRENDSIASVAKVPSEEEEVFEGNLEENNNDAINEDNISLDIQEVEKDDEQLKDQPKDNIDENSNLNEDDE
tara:strand:+ start:1914 stop:4532 length:2619 start_codon:yes stop_codon:yes gene_type:complete